METIISPKETDCKAPEGESSLKKSGQQKGKSRNDMLDFIKLIASYFVVLIHIRFYGDFGYAIVSVARFAVPLFFAVSGFFAYQNDIPRLSKKILNVFSLFVFSSVLYNVRDIIWSIKDYGFADGLWDYISPFTDIKQWINLVLFNDVFTSTHLWFLLALIYTYGMIILAQKLKLSERFLTVSAICILVVHLALRYGSLIWEYEINDVYFRNFFFMGYPFFMLGMLLKKHSSKLRNVNTAVLIGCIILGVAEPILSFCFLGLSELYIGSVLVSMALLILALKLTDVKISKNVVAIAQCNTYIYVFHNLVYNVLNMVLPMAFNFSTESKIYINLMPICICIATTIASICYMKVKAKLLKTGK